MSEGTYPAVREAVKGLTGVVGWFGASIAALTAVCYAAGYFAIHAHLAMLGFSDIVDVPNDQLLLEGGRFFYLTLQQMALGGMIIIISATILFAIAAAIYRIRIVRANSWAAWIRTRLGSRSAKEVAAELLPLFAIAIVIWHYNAYYTPTSSILSLENLALANPRGEAGTFAADVKRMILSGSGADRAALIDSYNFFVEVYALFIAVTWLMIYNRSSTTFGKAANFVFVVYTVILTAFLPLAFAVLVRTPIYPVADLTLKNGQQDHGVIVQRTDRRMLLWSPKTRHIISYGADDLAGYQVIDDRDIFAKE